MLPPRWVRRLVLTPVIPVLTVLLLTALPLWAIIAAFASHWLPGRLRPLRLLWYLLVYLVTDTLMLLALTGLWVAAGFGRRLDQPRWQDAHYALMRRYLGVLVATARHTFRLQITLDAAQAGLDPDTPDAEAAALARRPLLVFSRHAGMGDSFLLVHLLLQQGLRPRIVLRDTLQWAPTIDIGLNRVPTHFVTRGAPRGTGTRAVSQLAGGLGERDALVIFPEGRNFTPNRRRASITTLEERGEHDEAEAARELRHVLTPRSGGALAALEAAPEADVLFVAHTGLEDLSGVVDLWRGLPMDAGVQVRAWRVGRAQVPRVAGARTAWLLWWWRQIDAWILTHIGEQAIPDAAVEMVVGADDDLPR